MTVLVTGSNGFLGSALVERLALHGVRHIRCLVREGSDRSRLERLKEEYPDADIHYHTGTLVSRKDPLEAIRGVDTIYHLAASLSGAPADMFLNTVVGTKYLMEAVISENPGIHVVHVSSFSVYGAANLPAGSLITEQTPLETHPERRDPYAFVKWHQEKLLLACQKEHEFPLTILRPGVIYGPHGSAVSGRVGLQFGSIFLHLGGSNILPLSYVDNCAEAIVHCAQKNMAGVSVFNVHDDDLPTSREYLKSYKRQVKKVRAIPVPYPLLQMGSRAVEWYHQYSRGQLPAIFTPYKTANLWKGHRFDNEKLKKTGWRQLVSTQEGMKKSFDYFRNLK